MRVEGQRAVEDIVVAAEVPDIHTLCCWRVYKAADKAVDRYLDYIAEGN